MIAAVKCNKCGEMNGYFHPASNPYKRTYAYCRCRQEGWEICKRHLGNVRRRYRSTKIYDEGGRYIPFSVIMMLGPCSAKDCFTPAPELLAKVTARKEVY